MLERDVEKRLGEKIKAAGGLWLKFVSPGNAGVPDRIAVIGGRIYFVEMKQDRGRTTPLQDRQIARLRAAGAEVRVVHGDREAVAFAEEVIKA